MLTILQLRNLHVLRPALKLAFSVCLFVVFFAAPANAQDYYHLKKVDLPAPLKYSEVRAIRQDEQGFTWFTTSQGLWRFDGTDVQPFDAHDPQLPPNIVPDIIYYYDNYVLLFFDDSGGCRMFAYDTYTSAVSKYQLDEHPMNFYNSPQKVLLFYSKKGQLWQFSRKTGTVKKDNISKLHGWTAPARIENFIFDADGSTYLFYSEKVARVTKGRVYLGADTAIAIAGEKTKLAYASNVLSTPAYLLAEYANGVIIYDKKTLKKVYEYNGHNLKLVTVLNNSFIFLTDGAKLTPVDRLFKIQPLNDESGIGVIKNHIHQQDGGSILLATQKGMFELTPSTADNDDSGDKKIITGLFKGKSVRSICRLKNGKLYVGTYPFLYAIDNNTAKIIATNVVYCMTALDDNTLLAGIEGGNGFATIDTRTDKLTLFNNKNTPIFGFCLAKDSSDYVGGASYDLYRINRQTDGLWHSELFFHSDSLGFIKQMLKVKNDWLIACANGLFKLSNNSRLTRIFPLHDKYTVYAVQPDGDSFWLGTAAKGLIKIDSRGNILNHVKFSSGLAGEFVYSIFRENNLLYAGTNGGLSVFDTNAGMQAITAPDDEQYNSELNHSAIFYDGYRHQLIFGGVQGLLFPDMAHYVLAGSKKGDTVKLSYFKEGSNGIQPLGTDLFAGLQKNIVLKAGDVFMGLKFAGNNIWHKGSFLFRMPEVDTLWRKSDIDHEISFYALAPGRYTLQARFPSVTDPKYWLTKTIIVEPHYYQTWLFKLMIALTLALMIYAAWLSRARKIRNEHLLRTTIASDLHDEIGSALTRISLSSELMSIRQQMDAKEVERISSDSKSAIASISDIIWSVDARNDNKDDLILRMKEHAYNMLDEVATVNFETQGLDKVAVLPQLIRQNMYLIFKEAVNNIIRHNNKPTVWISLNNQANGMTITIKNTIDLKKKENAFAGQGLKNMQMRAKRMKAELNITSGDGLFTVNIKMKRW